MANITWLEPGEDEESHEENKERLAEFPLGLDGPAIFVRRSFPHGLLEIGTEKGPVPAALVGQWTDLEMAKLEIKKYIESTLSPVKLKPKGEPAKIKDATQTKKTKTLRETTKAKQEQQQHELFLNEA